MSRSYKHSPVFWSCSSNGTKQFRKQVWHSERAQLRQALAHGEFERAETKLVPYDEWEAPGDGKGWDNNFYPEEGFGVHLFSRCWSRTKDQLDELFRKAMRK